MAPRTRSRVPRWTVAGLVLGLAAGTVLVVPGGGEELVTPLVVPLGAAAAGGVLGAGVGLVAGSRRPAPRRDRRTAPAAAREPGPPPPPPLDPTALPAPTGGPDGSAAPEGWYADPVDDSEQRWWDGAAWTTHVWKPRRR